MKILHATRSLDPAMGGPVEVIKQVSTALVEKGHESSVVCLDLPTDPWLKGLPVHACGTQRTTYGYSPRLIPWLKEHAGQFDAIICHGLWGYHNRAVLTTADDTRVPFCIFPHGMMDPWFKRAYPIKHLKKCLYWLAVERNVLRAAHRVLFTCEEEQALAQATFPFYSARESIITLGTRSPEASPDWFRQQFFQRFPQLAGKRLLLFLGRLHFKKGCDLLLRAFKQVPSGMHLVIAGPCEDPDFGEKLRVLAGDSNANDVSFVGLLEGDLKWGALAAAEAFILPSHQENFGMAVAESLAMGTPVLISNRVNIWREIQQDSAGLVEPDTLEGTLALIQRWQTANQPALRAAAAACFSSRFDIRSTAEKIVTLFESHG